MLLLFTCYCAAQCGISTCCYWIPCVLWLSFLVGMWLIRGIMTLVQPSIGQNTHQTHLPLVKPPVSPTFDQPKPSLDPPRTGAPSHWPNLPLVRPQIGPSDYWHDLLLVQPSIGQNPCWSYLPMVKLPTDPTSHWFNLPLVR